MLTHSHCRRSFSNIVSLFGPTVSTLISNRHIQRDTRLLTEAKKAFIRYMLEKGTWADVPHALLSLRLELMTILCEVYRYATHSLGLKPPN